MSVTVCLARQTMYTDGHARPLHFVITRSLELIAIKKDFEQTHSCIWTPFYHNLVIRFYDTEGLANPSMGLNFLVPQTLSE